MILGMDEIDLLLRFRVFVEFFLAEVIVLFFVKVLFVEILIEVVLEIVVEVFFEVIVKIVVEVVVVEIVVLFFGRFCDARAPLLELIVAQRGKTGIGQWPPQGL
jgi:hypothetical protein